MTTRLGIHAASHYARQQYLLLCVMRVSFEREEMSFSALITAPCSPTRQSVPRKSSSNRKKPNERRVYHKYGRVAGKADFFACVASLSYPKEVFLFFRRRIPYLNTPRFNGTRYGEIMGSETPPPSPAYFTGGTFRL